MARSNPFLTWLRSLVQENVPAEDSPQPEAATEPEPSVTPAPPAIDPFLLELPTEHTVHKLYALWRQQVGWHPLPHFSFSGVKQILPESSAAQELARLKQSLNVSASKRMKEVSPQKKGAAESENIPPPNLDASVEVFVTADAMSAWVYAYPPVGQGAELDKGMICDALEEARVVFGVDGTLWDALPKDSQRYFRLFPAAQGQPAVPGTDGQVIDLFARKTQRKIQTDENNRVDYATISCVQNVSAGDPICHIVLPTQAEPGCTVLGKQLAARDGIQATPPKGRNTDLSEDGTILFATMTGHVEFTGRVFQIKPVLEIEGNVDYSSGNVNFLGDVHVHGDVCTGFSVRAMGSVTIDGVVEAGTVEAGGDLIIVKGAQGDGRAVLRSSHSIFAKYLESCCVYAVEGLHADNLINCEVYCDGVVAVTSGRGAVIGGSIRCAHEVEALAVGSRAEAPTEIVLGSRPCQEFDRELLLEEITSLEDKLKKMERQPESPTKFTRMGKLRVQITVSKKKLESIQAGLTEDENEVDMQLRRLICQVAYPGVRITIGTGSYHFRRETGPVHAYLRQSNGEIEII